MKKILFILTTLLIFGCTEDGELIEDQALPLCSVLQEPATIQQCEDIIESIVANQVGCEDAPTGDTQPLESISPLGNSNYSYVIYRTPGVSSSVQCKSTFIIKNGTELPGSVETVPYDLANIGDFDDGIPPFYNVVQIDTIGTDLIAYLKQGVDAVGNFTNQNAKCDCSTFPNFCKRIYVTDCISYTFVGAKFGLRAVLVE